MLAAYFRIPESAEGSKPPPKPPKKPKKPRNNTKPPSRKDRVQPFESGTQYARFEPAKDHHPAEDAIGLTADEQEMLQQLLQPGSVPAKGVALYQEEDNTDASSCHTFDDDTIDTASCGTSEANEADSPRWVAEKPRKPRAKASEVPVYAGPELWFEDDTCIE